MTIVRWAGFSLGSAVLLAILGIFLANILARVNQSVADTMTLRSSVLQASGDQLELWHDRAKTNPVTSLSFQHLRIQPPLRSIGPDMPQATIFVENVTTGDLYLVGPCGNAVSPQGTILGFLDALVSGGPNELKGSTCNAVRLPPGQLFEVQVSIELAPGLAAGDYAFQTVFEAVSQVAVPPPAGMVSWWPGDGNADDIVDGNHGVRLGGAGIAPGMVGEAFTLDGADEFVLVPASANLNITGDVTVDLWAKRTTFGLGYLAIKGAWNLGGVDVPAVFALRFEDDDRLSGVFETSEGVDIFLLGPSVTDGDFHHYAYVRSGDVHTLLLDGVVVASEDFDPANTGITPGDTSGIGLTIGAVQAERFPTGFGGHFGGIIDEVEVFNRALTVEEIRAIYEAGSAGKIKPPPPPPPEPVPPPAGMVSWWPGDGNADDIVDGNHGVRLGGAGIAPGMVGAAFTLDGADDFVLVPASANLNITGDVTVDMWAKRTVFGGDRVMIAKGAGTIGVADAPDAYFLAFDPTDHLYAGFERADGSNVFLTGPTVTDTNFHHYAYARSGDTHKLFMDGVVVAEATFTESPGDTSGIELAIGAERHDPDASGFIGYFAGLIDEVEIFSRALGGEEIRAIYDAGSAGKIKPPPPPPPEPIPPPAGMISWWPGDGNADDIVDGNHGTLSGDATFAPGMVGQAFSLDGTGDVVVVPDSPNLNITSDVTVDLWAKRAVVGSGSPVMIAKGAGAIGVVDAPDLYFLSFDSTDHLNGGFERADGSNVILVGPTVTDTNFHHYAYVRSGDTHNLFIDGVMVTGDTFTGSPGDTSGIELAIGALRHDAFPGGFCCHFGGVIDEVELFDRALTAAEIRAIYNAGGAGKIKPEPIPPPAGMVSWWPGDGNANDIVDGNPGTLQGGATFAPGIVGDAFSFDGVDDYVVVPDSANLDLTEQFTLDAWINPSSLHNAPLDGALISKVGGAAGNNGYQFGITGNNAVLLCQFNAAGEPWPGNQLIVDLPSAIPLHQWSHVACTYDNADLKIYVNGGLVGTQPVGAKSVVDSASNLRISGDDNNHVYFHGLIDEVEVFNRALTVDEIRAIYNAGSAGKIKPEPIPPPAGMVSWWPGDGNANDIMDGNPGALFGDATYAVGKVGQAFSFDGAGDSVVVPHGPSLNLIDFTLEAWIKPSRTTPGQYQAIITKNITPRPPSLWLYDDNIVRVYFDPVSLAAGSTTALTLGNWHHLAATYDGAAVKIYINGVLDVSVPATDTPATSVRPLLFGAGRDNNSFFFQGLMDDVAVYNRALIAEEVQSIYEAGSAGKLPPPPPEPIAPPAGMVSWWPGDGNPNDIMDANHGTLSGGTTYTGGKVDQSFSLDGTDDSVIVAHDPSLNLTDFTFDAWVKPSRTTPGQWQAIITKNVGPRPPSLWIYDTNIVQVYFDPIGLAAGSAAALNLNNWHHVAATYDGSAVKIYINGVLDVSLPATGAPATNTQPMHLGAGRDNNANFFQGLIDEVEIFNRALSADEIRAIYDAGSAGKIKPPPGEIHGSKFHDLDADEVWDEGEPGLPDFTIVLDIGDDGTGDRLTQTNATGDYWFMDVPLGPFRVSETATADWVQTHPIAGYYTGDLVSGDIIDGLDFGNRQELAQIAFASNREGGHSHVFVMDSDGANATRITFDGLRNREPSWSPDASKIAFISNRDGFFEIYVMDADGLNPVRLTEFPNSDDRDPTWSPDGTRIAFRSNRDSAAGDIFVMNADGSNPINLTNSGASDWYPGWSPDGTKIAFISNRGFGVFELYVMDADGSNATKLILPGIEARPAWSPDGTKIAFSSFVDGNIDIYVVDAGLTTVTRLTTHAAVDDHPSWSADGTKIVFQSRRDTFNEEIYVMNADDGSGVTRLTDDFFLDIDPDFSVGALP